MQAQPSGVLSAAVKVLLALSYKHMCPSFLCYLLQLAFTLAGVLRCMHPYRHHQLLHSLLCSMRGVRVCSLGRSSSSKIPLFHHLL